MEAQALSTVRDCYQCQKCSAGCPVASFMDYKPHQVMQMVSLGTIAPLLVSHTIWICASCYTCSTRCPNEVNVAGVMDSLRRRALSEKVVIAEEKVRLFHRAFLGDIRTFGRIHELSMMATYKMATKTYFDDMLLGWRMFSRGKLRLLPSLVKKRREIARLFAKENR